MPPATKRAAKGRLKEKDNVVSIWLGTMPSQEALTTYLDEDFGEGGRSPFARDLRVSVDDVEFIESSVSDDDAPANVLAGHTFAEQYGQAAEAAAKQLGLGRCNSAVVILDRAYTPPPDATFAEGSLTFVGVFPYNPDA